MLQGCKSYYHMLKESAEKDTFEVAGEIWTKFYSTHPLQQDYS